MLLPLRKFRSDANFAFFCLGIFFQTIFIHFDRLVVCIVIKHRYYFFADDFFGFRFRVVYAYSPIRFCRTILIDFQLNGCRLIYLILFPTNF